MKNRICPPLIGAHFSVAGGLDTALEEAHALNCTVVQLFTKNARTWKEKQPTPEEIQTFTETRKALGITHVFSHCSYLINIAAHEEEKRQRAIKALAAEMERSRRLGLDGVVLHPGSHLGKGEDAGIELAVDSLKQVMGPLEDTGPRLLIETCAGQGTGLGKTFQQIGAILSGVNLPDRMGVCLDTCHVFAAGYDLASEEGYEETFDQFEKTIGVDKLFALHLNDSKHPLGSKKDRHEHIGKGHIGEAGFAMVMADKRLSRVPKILETPKLDGDIPMDRVNLYRLRTLAQGDE